MFATANPRTQAGRLSVGGFDVRCLMFEVREKISGSAYFIVVADGVEVEQCR
jgi:hypothetical protein